MASIGRGRRWAAGGLAGTAFGLVMVAGCGNAGEGTVSVSPEARARLRGGPAPEPEQAKPAATPQKTNKARPGKLRKQAEG